MSHNNAPPETDVQRAVREFYSARMAQRGQTIAWGRDKQGRFLAEFARDAEAAWEAALSSQRGPQLHDCPRCGSRRVEA